MVHWFCSNPGDTDFLTDFHQQQFMFWTRPGSSGQQGREGPATGNMECGYKHVNSAVTATQPHAISVISHFSARQ